MEATTQAINPSFRGRGPRMCMLMRREFWEHRALWILPLALAALVLAGSLLALVLPGRIDANLRSHNSTIHFNGSSVQVEDQWSDSLSVHGANSNLARLIPGLADSGIVVELGEVTVGNLLRFFEQLPPSVRRQLLLLALLAMGKFMLLPLGFLTAILALNMFRQEARNRSIYFFKSMPVSEGEAVLAKFLVNVPLLLVLMLGTAILAQLIPLTVFSVAALAHSINPITLFWQPAPLAQVWGNLLLGLVLDFLLFMPALGFCYALNAWHSSRRFAALLVVAALSMVDKIYVTGGEFASWVGRHMVPPGWALHGPRGDVYVEAMGMQEAASFSWPDLAGGVLLGLLLLYASTHLLRWREEN